jgi:ferredoxin
MKGHMPTRYRPQPTGSIDHRRIDISHIRQSLMEAIRAGGIDELDAVCGGSCGTHHVYVEPRSLTVLPPIKHNEEGMLESSNCRQADSRLAYQIEVSDVPDGVAVTIAPQE